MSKTIVRVELTDARASVPVQGSKGAAGYDLCSVDSGVVLAGGTVLVQCGIKIALPPGITAMVCSRSGLAVKNSVFVLNAPGIIDSDYRGSIGIILHNAGKTDFKYDRGARLGQLVFIRHNDVLFEVGPVDEDTERGAGGYGSTGV